MNFVGFLAIHHPGYPFSKDINGVFSTVLQQEELSEIIDYLDRGIPLITFISSLYEKSGEFIGPNVIYTDGFWIWPGYYSYYLKKYPRPSVPEVLKMRIKETAKNGINLDQQEKRYAEYMLAKALRIVRKGADLSGIKDLIIERGEEIVYF